MGKLISVPKQIRLGELFCGPGGIGWGAHLANKRNRVARFIHAFALDKDIDSIRTYKHNIPGATEKTVYCEDVQSKKFRRILNFPDIEGFAYGFPCNDFSIVGKHRGLDGSHGPLYSYGLPFIEKKEPLFFLAENVGGIESANNGKALDRILFDLANIGVGYNITIHKFKFEEYGIPQCRHRVIIVGIRSDLDVKFLPPKPRLEIINCEYALTNQPIPEDALNHDYVKQSETVINRLKYIKPGENAWTANIPENLKLKDGKATLSQIYKRLDPKKPAYTITGSGGGGTHCYHWKEDRALTNRERARLQTFPDDYVFFGKTGSVRKQIGMAVPPKAAEFLFDAIRKTILRKKYPSIMQNINISQHLKI